MLATMTTTLLMGVSRPLYDVIGYCLLHIILLPLVCFFMSTRLVLYSKAYCPYFVMIIYVHLRQTTISCS